jgi:NADH-quinone oxidoreductase subunit D
VQTSTFEIPVGPQHPALKEPENFTFIVDGEQIVKVKARIGYNHRGIEKAAESRSYIQNIYLIERICGICNVAHTTCYCQNVEYLYEEAIPRRAEFIRVIVTELNRIHSHLLWLGVAGHEIGFDTFFMYVWRDRERVMDMIEMVTGNRVNTAINTIGGVRRDITGEIIERMKRSLEILKDRTEYYKKVAMSERTVTARTEGIGILKPDEAVKLCAVGPTLRASGIKSDTRRNDPHLVYDEIPFNVVTYDSCDVLARILVRIDEVLESIDIIQYCLEHMPSGPIRIRLPRAPPVGESVSLTEAPRGELIHYVKSNGTERPERYKVRSPTLGNIPAVCEMLTSKGDYIVNIADIPIVLASIDPCFSCTDRSIRFTDPFKGGEWVWSYEQLKKHTGKSSDGFR